MGIKNRSIFLSIEGKTLQAFFLPMLQAFHIKAKAGDFNFFQNLPFFFFLFNLLPWFGEVAHNNRLFLSYQNTSAPARRAKLAESSEIMCCMYTIAPSPG